MHAAANRKRMESGWSLAISVRLRIVSSRVEYISPTGFSRAPFWLSFLALLGSRLKRFSIAPADESIILISVGNNLRKKSLPNELNTGDNNVSSKGATSSLCRIPG